MSVAGGYSPAELRQRLNRSIDGIVSGLDRGHYPRSLLDLLSQALLPPDALRALPLLALAVDRGRSLTPESCPLAAAEMFLRGYFLQAELLLTERDRPGGGLAAELRKRFTQAQILLAADTLFTLPFEILAGSPDNRDSDAVQLFSDCFGPDGVLGRLDGAGESAAAFLTLDPLGPLAVAALGGESPENGYVGDLCRLAWYREAGAWFGENEFIAAAKAEAVRALESSKAPPGPEPELLFEYLAKD